jgi:hypothetical protein
VRCYKVYLFPAASVAPPYGPRTRPGHVYPKAGGCSSARTYPPSRRAIGLQNRAPQLGHTTAIQGHTTAIH